MASRRTTRSVRPHELGRVIGYLLKSPANNYRVTLRSDGFGIEPELTAKIFKRGYRVYEIPITYAGRGYSEGKKITWVAGLVALWVLLKYRFTE